MKEIHGIDYSFNNECIECHSKNIEIRGQTEILKRDIYLCNDCLKVFSVEDSKWYDTKRAIKIDDKICIIA